MALQVEVPAPPASRRPLCARAAVGGTIGVTVHADAPTTEFSLPALDVRALARRAAVPAVVAALVLAAIVAGGGGATRAFADALARAVSADPRWVVAAAAFEVLSFAGYVLVLWLVAGRATPRMRLRESAEVTLAGAAATRLMPTGGVGGAALTLFALQRTGLGARGAGRTLLTFLVLLYAVFLAAIAVAGGLLALGAAPTSAPLALCALPAALATAIIATVLTLGLRHRRGAGAAQGSAGAPAVSRTARLRSGAGLLGAATDDALRLVASADPRALGALAWWTFDAAVLGAMLSAFGASAPLLVVVLAYFVGQAGNLVPIPGAVSGGIAGVLVACGVDADLAITSVLGYRAVAIWLPAPVGLAALASLRTTLARWQAEPAPR